MFCSLLKVVLYIFAVKKKKHFQMLISQISQKKIATLWQLLHCKHVH